MKHKLNIILLIGWMSLIFIFSHQTGVQSSETSGFVQELLSQLTFLPQTLFGLDIQFIIRKSAHMFEYFILAMLAYRVLLAYESDHKALAQSLIFTFIYACTDEFHQTFVIGRSGSLSDVYIDTLGGALFIFYRICFNIIKSKHCLSKKTDCENEAV